MDVAHAICFMRRHGKEEMTDHMWVSVGAPDEADQGRPGVSAKSLQYAVSRW